MARGFSVAIGSTAGAGIASVPWELPFVSVTSIAGQGIFKWIMGLKLHVVRPISFPNFSMVFIFVNWLCYRFMSLSPIGIVRSLYMRARRTYQEKFPGRDELRTATYRIRKCTKTLSFQVSSIQCFGLRHVTRCSTSKFENRRVIGARGLMLT